MDGKKKKIIIYHSKFNAIGGTITWLLNFCKTFYQEYQIIIFTDTRPKQEWVVMFRPYASIVSNFIHKLECDYLIINRLDSKPEVTQFIKAKKVYHMIHCDMDAMRNMGANYRLKFPNAEYISVSEPAQHALMRVCRTPSIVIPNIVLVPPPKKMLRLVSATRLTNEKGYDLMKKMATRLQYAKIPYTWDVYTDGHVDPTLFNKKEPIMNVAALFPNYDYVVQLSKAEGFCYTLYEALQMGVPVIATPFPAAKQEILDGANGYITGFNLELLDVNKIYNEIPKFAVVEQDDITDLWRKILV